MVIGRTLADAAPPLHHRMPMKVLTPPQKDGR
jgi:hypothetical protein